MNVAFNKRTPQQLSQQWQRRRNVGETCAQIARNDGYSESYVSQLTTPPAAEQTSDAGVPTDAMATVRAALDATTDNEFDAGTLPSDEIDTESFTQGESLFRLTVDTNGDRRVNEQWKAWVKHRRDDGPKSYVVIGDGAWSAEHIDMLLDAVEQEHGDDWDDHLTAVPVVNVDLGEYGLTQSWDDVKLNCQGNCCKPFDDWHLSILSDNFDMFVEELRIAAEEGLTAQGALNLARKRFLEREEEHTTLWCESSYDSWYQLEKKLRRHYESAHPLKRDTLLFCGQPNDDRDDSTVPFPEHVEVGDELELPFFLCTSWSHNVASTYALPDIVRPTPPSKHHQFYKEGREIIPGPRYTDLLRSPAYVDKGQTHESEWLPDALSGGNRQHAHHVTYQAPDSYISHLKRRNDLRLALQRALAHNHASADKPNVTDIRFHGLRDTMHVISAPQGTPAVALRRDYYHPSNVPEGFPSHVADSANDEQSNYGHDLREVRLLPGTKLKARSVTKNAEVQGRLYRRFVEWDLVEVPNDHPIDVSGGIGKKARQGVWEKIDAFDGRLRLVERLTERAEQAVHVDRKFARARY